MILRTLNWGVGGLVASTWLLCASASAQSVSAYLASNCATCHGTEGRSVSGGLPSLAGRSRSELLDALQAFKTGTRPATLMHQIAKGYTDAQLEQLATFFAQQSAGH